MVNESSLNIQKEKEIVKQLISLVDVYDNSSQGEQSLMKTAINSLISELTLISDATSELIRSQDKPVKREYQRVETSSGTVFVNKKNKEDFMKQVGLENEVFKKIRTTKKTKE